MQETPVWSLSQEYPLEEEMATHSSVLAWRSPWTEEPGRLQSMGCKELDTLSDWTCHLKTDYGKAAAAAKSLQSCPTLCDPIDGSPPWGSPGKNTGVGCHFLLQRMKVKSESEVTPSCPTRSNPMDCSLPGSSIHGIFQARVLEWGAIAFIGFSVKLTKLKTPQLHRSPSKFLEGILPICVQGYTFL